MHSQFVLNVTTTTRDSVCTGMFINPQHPNPIFPTKLQNTLSDTVDQTLRMTGSYFRRIFEKIRVTKVSSVMGV